MKQKIQTAKIKEEIYYSLVCCELYLKEKKRCHWQTRGTGDLLYIDQHILQENKMRRKNIAITWIDYKKAYGMLPQTWIIESLKMYKISNKGINFIMEAMTNWKMKSTAGGKSLAEVKIQKSIFQGDSHLPLLFVMAIMPLNYILRKSTRTCKFTKSQKKINHL